MFRWSLPQRCLGLAQIPSAALPQLGCPPHGPSVQAPCSQPSWVLLPNQASNIIWSGLTFADSHCGLQAPVATSSSVFPVLPQPLRSQEFLSLPHSLFQEVLQVCPVAMP